MKRIVMIIVSLMLVVSTVLAEGKPQVITMDTSNVPEIPEGTLSDRVYRQSDLCRVFRT